MMKRIVSLFFAFCIFAARVATAASATTPEFRLSLKSDGIRASAGEETLRYSPIWDGGSNETAKVTLKQGDAVLAENLTAEGDYAWSVTKNGTYALTHTTYTNGAVAMVLNATFVVTGKDIPFPPGSVTATGYSGKYDGNGHGITVKTTDVENPSITYARTEAGPYTAVNPLFTNVCNETVWYVVAAPGYITETNSAKVVITQGDIGGGGGEEPGPGEIPEGGLSKFDATYVYDGEGHTIKTNELVAAANAAVKGVVATVTYGRTASPISSSVGGDVLTAERSETAEGRAPQEWVATAPSVTNVGEYVVWYRITAPNYSNYVHAAKVTITPSEASIWYVDDANGDDENFGSSWACAKKTIQGAINVAISGNKIIVTNGVYSGVISEDSSKTLDILSVNGPDNTAISGAGTSRCVISAIGGAWHSDLAYYDACVPHKALRFQGFTMCHGAFNSVGRFEAVGGGAIGGVYSNCVFRNNIAQYVGNNTVGDGGAVWCGDLYNCTVMSNYAAYAGGGVAKCNVHNSTLLENEVGASGYGGGAYQSKLKDCTIAGNKGTFGSAVREGEARHCIVTNNQTYYTLYNLKMFDCLIANNQASNNGMLANECDMYRCTVVGNGVDCGILSYRGSMNDSIVFGNNVKYDLKTRWTEYNNTCTSDPSFVDAENGNYRLKAGSRCIDAGGACDESLDLDGNPRVVNGKVDLGAYEFQIETAVVRFEIGSQGNYVGGGALTQRVVKASAATAPVVSANAGWEFKGWDKDFSNVQSDMVVSALWTKLVSIPAVADKVFTGEKQTADVVETDDYEVTENDGGISVGTYYVTLTLKNPDAAKWNDGQGGTTRQISWKLTKKTIGSDDDPERPDPEHPLPPGAVSKFDGVAMYDGAGHTLETDKLVEAFRGVIVGEFAVQYARGGLGQPALPWRDEPFVFTNACEEIVWYKVSNPNYEDYVHAAKVAVTNRPITVTSASGEWVYDTTAHGTNGVAVAGVGEEGSQGTEGTQGTVIAGLIGDDSLEMSGFPSITDVGSKANAFAWAFGAGTLATNYCVSCVTGTLTVTARPIGDDPAKWDIRLGEALTYNGSEQTAPIIQVAFRNPDGNLVDIPYTVTGDKGTDADNYSVKISGSGNYSGTVEKEWAITERNVTLTSMTTNWVYDGVAHTADVVTVTGDGFVDGEGVSFAGFPGVRHVSDAPTPIENTFTYSWNDGTKAKNYSVKASFGTVQMSKLPVTVTSKDISKTYDGTPLKLTAEDITVAAEGAQGTGNGALPAGESFTYTGLAERTEAGQIDASFTVADGTALVDDYAITKVFGKLTVKKNATEITVTAKSKSWTYDGDEHQLHEYDAPNAASVLLAGDALDVVYDAASVVQTPVDGPKADGVVSNVITNVRVLRNGTEDVTKNYTLSWYPGTLTVTKRPVTLTSKDATKPYDGTALTKHEVTVGGDGFVGADDADYSFTGTQTEKGTSKNTFSYSLKSGTNAAYYDITTEEGALEVTAADITGGGADDLVVTLGPSLTYNGLLQLQTVASVTFKGLVVDCSVTENQQKDAGDYQLTLTGRGNFAGVTNIAWTLLPKALTLTAGDGSKPYDGTPLTVASVGAEGFVSGEGATYVCEGSQLDVGDSANVVSEINWDANTKGTNYAVTKKPGKLTVTPRAVTVTSKNISKPYDGSPLTLTAADIEVTLPGAELGRAGAPRTPQSQNNAISLNNDCGALGDRALPAGNNTVGGDVLGAPLPAGESFVYDDFAARTESGQTSATFSIAAGPNTKLSNYTITPVYGTITITKSATEIGVTAKSQTWTYDGETHKLNEYEATNHETLQKGDELHVEFDTASAVTSATDGPKGDGVVPNTITSVKVMRNGTQDVTDNYTVTPYPGTLTVKKRPVTVVVGGHSETVTYDGEEHTISGYDISTEDELYDIDADTTFSGTDSAKGTDADTYKMGLKSSDFANGNANFAVEYAVTDGKLTISPLDIGAADVVCEIVLGANPKYNGAVQTIEVVDVTAQRGAPGGRALPVTYTLTGQNATDAGVYTLTVKGTGNFTGEKSTTWQILKREVTLTSGSASKVYDGTPLTNDKVEASGDGFVANEGVTYTVTGSQTAAGTGDNAFTYTRKAGTKAENYTITQVAGKLTVTQATLGGEPGTGAVPAGGLSKYDGLWIFDGKNHTIDTNKLFAAFDASDCGPYTVVYGMIASNWSAVPPTIRDAGTTSVWYKVISQNYEDFAREAKVTVVPKTITEEMLDYSDDKFFFDGTNTSKKLPDVILVDTNDLGVVISTSNDWTRVIGERIVATGEYPVTLTGTNNYTGSATRPFKPIKRPTQPPVVEPPDIVSKKSYNGKLQVASIPEDSRWTVVENAGGIDAGKYPVVLRLTTPADYKWKGYAEDGPDTWTGVFVITPAGNKVNRLPSIKSWTNGVQQASVPTMGGSKWGGPAEYVEYRVRGADPSTGVREQPSKPGKYTARFVWPEAKNYTACFYDIDFEIFSGPGCPDVVVEGVTVPGTWLAPYVADYGGGDPEVAARETGLNGFPLWQSYVAGLDPDDPTSQFEAIITIGPDGIPLVTPDPDLSGGNPPRVYTILGKANLADKDWTPVNDQNKAGMRFFKVQVSMPQ